jgi:hypothetical protein
MLDFHVTEKKVILPIFNFLYKKTIIYNLKGKLKYINFDAKLV